MVLIVDDEPNLCLLYETELRRAGFDTISATSAERGIEFMDVMHPDLVVLDIRMPGMDGVEALQRVLDRDSTVPVVVNTAYPSYHRNYLTWTADAFVTKSSDVTELVRAVRELLH